MGPGLSGSGSAVSTIGVAGRSQVAGWKDRILPVDADWPQKPTGIHCVIMSMGAASAQMGRPDMSHCSGWSTISACSGHSRWFSTVSRRMSVHVRYLTVRLPYVYLIM